MRRFLLIGAALLPVAAHAVEIPKPGADDSRVRTVAYQPMNVVTVDAGRLRSTVIELGKGEEIGPISLGDVKAWSVQPAGNYLFLKPKSPATGADGTAPNPRQQTNLQLVAKMPDGSTRLYQFELVAVEDPSKAVYSIVFRYPGDIAAARRKAEAAREAKREEERAKAQLDQDTFYGARNWRYEARGSAVIQPAEVSDNGEETVFRFLGRTKIPAIYEKTANGEAIVAITVKNDMVIAHTVAREWVLRDGKEVCDIRNLGFNHGYNPRTGTTSPDVVRAVKGSGK